MDKYAVIEDLSLEYERLISKLWGYNPIVENYKTQQYQQPIEGDLVSRHAPGFATPTHPQGHTGIDLKADRGTPVFPIGPGHVLSTGQDPKGGNFVKTVHQNGKVQAYYAHLDSVNVQKGQPVDYRTVIGTVGDTGNARGNPHLHYQVSIDGTWVDPQKIGGMIG